MALAIRSQTINPVIYKRTFANFSKLYSPFADEWFVVDNSKEPVIIAQKMDNQIEILNKELFNKLFNG